MVGYKVAGGLVVAGFLVFLGATSALVLSEVRSVRSELDRYRLTLVEDAARERAVLVSDITAKCDFSRSDDPRFGQIAAAFRDLAARTESLERFTKIP